ncbi:VaFE repeat-containing surface-anchored protein [Paracoccus spongiarum]|uniref:VaFE repeat-containing surface-anchored protein n=1 Tax=Paracoccus spongiarum TaxID=3064387 RepID=A0ABT9JGH5_9RHOB|nr:VaFE repeat-containing surface-anchored protein [Paracoccus sp. 2205BS29-5]MDP5308715.1 VaFE repeat-containing surface-anchored protein [Paracoccus sp. 2205BS29-5]
MPHLTSRARAAVLLALVTVVTAPVASAQVPDARAGLAGVVVDAADGNRFFTRSGGVARDDVTFDGLVPGQHYTLRAQLVDVQTGQAVGEPLFTGFTAEAAEGTMSLELPVPANRTRFNIDYASQLTLYAGDVDEARGRGAILLAALTDAESPERVVQVHAVQRIAVTAVDGADGDHSLPAEGGTIKATVAYENLVEGYDYTLWGELLTASGQSTAIFASIPDHVPDSKNGSVTMSFSVPEGLEGQQLIPSVGLYHQSRVELLADGRLTVLPDAPNPVMIASDPNLDVEDKRVDVGEPFRMDDQH